MKYQTVGKVVFALGVVLAANAALAQTAGPTLRGASSSIVPVTGPSTGHDLAETTKPALIPASKTTGTLSGARGDAAAAARAPAAVKVVHKPGSKPVVKKAAAPKRAKVATHSVKAKQVTTAKRGTPAGQAVQGKSVNPGKRQAPAKNGTPATTVVPRV